MYKTIGSKIVKIDEGRNGLINETSMESRTNINEYALVQPISRLAGVAFKMNTIKREIEESTGQAQLIRSFRDLSEGAADILSNQIHIEGILNLHKKTIKNLEKYIANNSDILNLYSLHLKREGLNMLLFTYRHVFPSSWIPNNYSLNSGLRNLTAESVAKLMKFQDKTTVVTSYSSTDMMLITKSIGHDSMQDFLLTLSSAKNWEKYTVETTDNFDILERCNENVYDPEISSNNAKNQPVRALDVMNNCVGILAYLETHYLSNSLNTEIEEEIISESHLGSNDDVRKILAFLADLLFEVSVCAVLEDIGSLNRIMKDSSVKNAFYERVEVIKTMVAAMK